MAIELGTLIKEQKGQLEKVTAGLAEGNRDKVIAALGGLGLSIVTGHPEIAALTPLLQEGVRKAFASPATARLRRAIAQAEASERVQQDRDALVAQIAEGVEVLLGQALIQLVRVQHHLKDEVVEQLGGLRAEFASFREEFQDSLDDADVRIDKQRVRDGAIGIRVSPGAARAHVWIGEMTVSGFGTIGIDLKRR